MLTRLALIAPPGLSQQKLRAALSRPLSYVVREFQSLEEIQANLRQFPFAVLIARLPQFEMHHVKTIEKLSQVFPHAGLITVSPKIDPQARFLTRHLKRHSVLDEELEFKDLDRIIEKAAKPWETPTARMHPRARRKDEAVLVMNDERYDEDFFHDATFLDFARMGARLQIPQTLAQQLAPKSRLELRYRSSEDVSKVHRLETRVVWLKKSNPLLSGSKYTIGLKFVAEL